ncbi:type II secretion system protein N [Janthinobacterium agaricidamnosum]|uniref:Type II secretion system protein GspC N-terminal domain-containing protein n=1 Tax=Janthinobacterium agaricidamnosum NBRC 102515 = DSM 9628 TaxID=1349767 RepID=W0VCL4_9BURK|nr:type II secretion system protein N [Janthinobacterium agaricidamnosum]CDG85651.1 hypothetical protein GJA_5052 [Janthinobacterium agaricidamnosum NBRC 102515 = DSM 9628]
MKRLSLLVNLVSFIVVVALSASLAYWAMQLFKLPQRPISAAPEHVKPDAAMDAAGGLFGGRIAVAAASNYQLKGVVASGSGRGSVAILAADGQPAKAFPAGAEVSPGVTVKEVQPLFVLLSENGVSKRVELAQEDKSAAGVTPGQPVVTPQVSPPPPPPPATPQPQPQPSGVQMPAAGRVNVVPAPGMPSI